MANSLKDSINEHAATVSSSIQAHTLAMSEHSKKIVASNSQIKAAIEDRFERLADINAHGFNQITSAIEAMHSDLNYNLNFLNQQIEFQNKVMLDILQVLELSFDVEVHQLYNKGRLLLKQGRLVVAVEYFMESIKLTTGRDFFPSHYALGRLYLLGKDDEITVYSPKLAMESLFLANYFGEGIFKINPKIKNELTDCKFLLSQSYYRQCSNKNNAIHQELACNAIKYAEEAVQMNPNLSNGYYHLAMYYGFIGEVDKLLSYLQKAIEMDRKYALDIYLEEVSNQYKNEIDNCINKMRLEKFEIVGSLLLDAQIFINKIQTNYISLFPLHNPFGLFLNSSATNLEFESDKLKYQQLFDIPRKYTIDNQDFLQLITETQLIEKDYHIQTYFGIDGYLKKLKPIVEKLELIDKLFIKKSSQIIEQKERDEWRGKKLEANRLAAELKRSAEEIRRTANRRWIKKCLIICGFSGILIGGRIGIYLTYISPNDYINFHLSPFFNILTYAIIVGVLGVVLGAFFAAIITKENP